MQREAVPSLTKQLETKSAENRSQAGHHKDYGVWPNINLHPYCLSQTGVSFFSFCDMMYFCNMQIKSNLFRHLEVDAFYQHTEVSIVGDC